MSAAGFERLVGATGPGDLSKLVALRALVDRANVDGSVERANWLTGVREEYQRWYARHNAHGHPENFPAEETLRYLDEHIVRTLEADGVLQPVSVPGGEPGADGGEVGWHAVRLSAWAAAEVDAEREGVLGLLDARIRGILEPGDSAAPVVENPDADAPVDLPPAPALDGPAVHAARPAEPVRRPGEMLVPGGATLAAKGLVKTYRKRRVVNDVDLHVSQGEIVGLLGPNGAGKTTSFYMMVGLIRPDKGKVFIGQRDLTGVPMYRRARAGIGYLAQEPSIFRKLSVEENVMAILQMMKIPRAERKKRLETLLDELSIKHLRKTRAYALSGGERRRLEITRALVGHPKFMLLDEPFAGVDPIAVHDIQQIVSDLRRRGIGVLISDHNVEQTLDIVDRAYIMYDGRVRVSGTVAELVWNEEVAEIYLGPTLTARMRERYPNPALLRPADAIHDGAVRDDAVSDDAISDDAISDDAVSDDAVSDDASDGDGAVEADDARWTAEGAWGEDGAEGMDDGPLRDTSITIVRMDGGSAAGAVGDDGADGGMDGPLPDRGVPGDGAAGRMTEYDSEEGGRVRAAAEGTAPVGADDDGDGERGGAGEASRASQG